MSLSLWLPFTLMKQHLDMCTYKVGTQQRIRWMSTCEIAIHNRYEYSIVSIYILVLSLFSGDYTSDVPFINSSLLKASLTKFYRVINVHLTTILLHASCWCWVHVYVNIRKTTEVQQLSRFNVISICSKQQFLYNMHTPAASVDHIHKKSNVSKKC